MLRNAKPLKSFRFFFSKRTY